MTTGTCPI